MSTQDTITNVTAKVSAPKIPSWKEISTSKDFAQMDKGTREQLRNEHFAATAKDAIDSGRIKPEEYDAAWNEYYLATQPDIDAGVEYSTTEKVLGKIGDLGQSSLSSVGEILANKVIGTAELIDIAGRQAKQSIRNKSEAFFGQEATDTAFDAIGEAVDVSPFGNPTEPIRKLGEYAKVGAKAIDIPRWKQGIDTEIAKGIGQVATQALITAANAPVAAASFYTEMLATAAEDMKTDPATNLLKEEDREAYAQITAKQQAGQSLTPQEQRRLRYIDTQRQNIKDMAALTSGAAQGALEKLSFDRIMKAFPPSIKNKIVRIASDIGIAGATEAATEGLQSLTQDIVRWAATNPDAEIGKTFSDEATVGGAVGALVRAAMPGTYRAPKKEEDETLQENITYDNLPERFVSDEKPAEVVPNPISTEQPAIPKQPVLNRDVLKNVDLSRAIAESEGQIPQSSAPTQEEIRNILNSDVPVSDIVQKARLSAEGYQPVNTAKGEVLYNPNTDEVSALGNLPIPKSPITATTDPIEALASVAAARQETVQPTEAQKQSGNYQKGKVFIQGLPIAIETPKGAERSGKSQDGTQWSVTMPVDYGYINRTEGADGDQLDVFIGQNPQNDTVFVIDQQNEDGSFDEHKAMLGFTDAQQAVEAYSNSFSDGKGQSRIAGITPMKIEEFKQWIKNEDTTAPLSSPAKFAKESIDLQSEKIAKMPVRQLERYRANIEPLAVSAQRQDYMEALDSIIRQKKNPATPLETSPETQEVKQVGRTRGIRRNTSKAQPDSILDFIADWGGMYDDAGELRARGLQDWHKQQAFRRRLIRQSNSNVANMFGPSSRDDRYTPDSIALAAWQRGYFPMHSERPTVDDLYALIDNTRQEEMNRIMRGEQPQQDTDEDADLNWLNSQADYYGIDTEGKTAAEVYDEVAQAMEETAVNEAPELVGDMVYELSYEMNRQLEAVGMDDVPFADDDIPFNSPMIPPTSQEITNGQSTGTTDISGTEAPFGNADQVSASPQEQTQPEAGEGAEELNQGPAQNRQDEPSGNGGNQIVNQELFSTEQTQQGEQIVIPGAERISDKQLAERKMQERMAPKKPQKEAGEDGGLFDTGARQQVDMFDSAMNVAVKPETDTFFDNINNSLSAEPNPRDVAVAVGLPREWNIDITKMTKGRLDRLLGKEVLSKNDVEDLKEYKLFLLTDRQSAEEKGFYKLVNVGDNGRPSYMPTDKFRIANIDAAIAKSDTATNPSEVLQPLSKEAFKDSTLIASAPTEERLTALAKKHFYSDSIRIEGDAIYNAKGLMENFGVNQKGGRFQLLQLKNPRNESAKPSELPSQTFGAEVKPSELKEEETPLPPAALPAPVKTGVYSASEHADVKKNLEAGSYTADEVRALFKRAYDSQDAIAAEIGKLTKEAIGKQFGVRGGAYGRSATKDYLVKQAYDNILSDFYYGGSFSWSPMQEKLVDAYKRLVNAQTDEDIAKGVAARTARNAEIAEYRESTLRTLSGNPQTLEEYRLFVREKGKEALTADQLADYDRMATEDMLAKKKAQQERKAQVQGVSSSVQGSINAEMVETKHTQKGHDLFVVKLIDRVEKDVYTTLNTAAKRLGGYYSSYRGMGATPGFQFTTQDAADKFMAVLGGESVQSESRRTPETKAEKLRAQGQRIIDAGEEKLNQDRKVNTSRRATQAASAEASAAADIALGKTMQNLAARIESGTAGILEGISTRVEVETLNGIMRRAMYKRDQGIKDLTHDQRVARRERKFENEDAVFIEYPLPSFHLDNLPGIAEDLSKRSGYKLLAQHLGKLYQAAKKDGKSIVPVVDPKYIAKIKEAAEEFDGKLGWLAEDGVDDYMRLQRMGITHAGYLRHAVREYAALVAGKKAADPIKEAERKLVGRKWEGYFPTPESLAERMAMELDVRADHRVLEPSAGKGSLIDAVVMAGADPANVEALEIVGDLRDILKLKGYNIVGNDFMSHEGQYDRIIMNPPFEKGQDIDHVRRAYDMLHPNGRIVAIMSEGPFYRSDSKAQEFRAWLDDKGGTSEKLPEGSFKDSDRSTGVNTRLVIIDKPDGVRFRVEDADGVAMPTTERISYTPIKKYTERQKVYARNVKRILRENFGENLNLRYMDRLYQDGYVITGVYSPGEYTGAESLIAIALADDANPYSAIKHEGIHYLRRVGALDTVWGDLRRKAESEWMDKYSIKNNYPNMPEETQIEEAIAEAFADYATVSVEGKPNRLPTRIEAIFRKIKAFFDSLRSYMKGEGFSTWRDIFEDIDAGKYRQADGAVARANAVGQDMMQQRPVTMTDAFKKWFGNSKVVDAGGKPLVVYHGTPDARFLKGDDAQFKGRNARWGGEPRDDDGAHWFASSRKTASTYADDRRAFDYQNAEAGVEAFYVSLQNPLIVDGGGKNWREAQKRGKTTDVIDEARANGHDGVIIKNVRDDYNNDGRSQPTDTFVAFSPTQIKSINNYGEFNPEDPRILFQRQLKQNGHKKEAEQISLAKKLHNGTTPLKRWAKKSWKRNLTKEGLLNEESFELKLQKDGAKNAAEYDVARMVHDLDADVKAVYGKDYKKLSAAEKTALRDYMSGNKDSGIPDGMKQRIDHLRDYLDRGSSRMQDSIAQMVEIKIADLPDAKREQAELYLNTAGVEGRLPSDLLRLLQMYQTIETNKGTYVNRSYQAFDDPDWKEKALADEAIMADARAYMQEQYPDLTEDEVTGEIRAILTEAQKKGNFVSFLSSGSKVGQKDVSFLRRRKDIPKPIRQLLGEYEDPKVNFVRTATKMNNWLANQQFLYNLRVAGNNTFLFTRPVGEFDTLIASEGNDTLSPLDGMYTTADFVQGMEDVMNPSSSNHAWWLQQWLRFNAAVKYGKTIGSPTTQFRNFESGTFFAIINGHWNFLHTAKAFKAIAADFKKDSPEWHSYLRELIELGVLHDNPYSGELKAAIEDVIKIESYTGEAKARAALDFFQRVYQASDDFWKINGFENEMARLKAIRPNLSDAERKKLAAKRIRDGYPTYSMVPRIIREIRRFPVAGSFVSFTWESMRTFKNQFLIMADDYRHGGLGAIPGRSIGLATASSLFAAASAMSMAMFGLDDEDDEAVRDLAPEWQKNSQILYLGYDEEGHPVYIDLSFLDPYSYVKRPLTALMNGNNVGIGRKVWDALKEMFSPYYGLEIGTSAIVELLTNKNSDTGQPIYIENDTVSGIAGDIAKHFSKVLPGIYTSIKGFEEAFSEQTLPRGKQRTVGDETRAFFGLRSTTMSVPTALLFKAWEFSEAERSVIRIVKKEFGKPEHLTDNQLRNAYIRLKNAREMTFNEMRRAVGAAKKLNVTDDRIRAALKAGGMTREDIDAIVDNKVTPSWTMSRQFIKNFARTLIVDEPDVEKQNKLIGELVRRVDLLVKVMGEK